MQEAKFKEDPKDEPDRNGHEQFERQTPKGRLKTTSNLFRMEIVYERNDGNHKETDTNVVMPVDFVRLIWVAIIGYLAFGEIPDLFTWIGGAMIFASALYIAYREGVRRRREAP